MTEKSFGIMCALNKCCSDTDLGIDRFNERALFFEQADVLKYVQN